MAIIRITKAVQQARFTRRQVNPRNVSQISRELFAANPMLVYTGINQPFFDNCQIGKTSSCLDIFNSLRIRGRAEFRDIKRALRMDNRPTSRTDLDEFTHVMIDSLPEADFYILDEIHHAFPRDPRVNGKGPWGIPIFRGQEYNEAMFGFWQKLGELKQAGSKFLLVTALHPQQAEYLDFLHDTRVSATAEFFTSPVLELTHDYGD